MNLHTQGDSIESSAQSQGQVISPVMTATVNTPAAATQAIATLAAGAAGVKHVLYGVIASIACGATAQTPISVQVLDGSTVIFAAELAAPVDGYALVQIMGLHIEGTAAMAMKLQFGAAGVTASVQAVTMLTYDVG